MTSRKSAWCAIVLAILLTFISFGMVEAGCPKVCVTYDKDGNCIEWEEDCPDVYAPRGNLENGYLLASCDLSQCFSNCKLEYVRADVTCANMYDYRSSHYQQCLNRSEANYDRCINQCQILCK